MTIPSFSVRKKVTITMFILILLVVGIFSLVNTGMDLLPEMTYPMISISTEYEGASPFDVEELVTRPIERMVSTVSRVKKVLSISQEGNSVVMVEFEWGANLDFAAQDIRENISFIKKFLPQGVEDSIIFKFDITQMPVLIYGITGIADLKRLHKVSEESISPRIERLDGVASAITMGGEVPQVEIALNREKVSLFGIDMNGVVAAIAAGNVNLPGGFLEQGSRESLVRTLGKFETLDDVRNLVVGSSKTGVPIHLRDIAEVRNTVLDRRNIIRMDGKDCLFLMVSKESGANALKVSDRVIEELDRIKEILPKSLEFHKVFDQADMIRKVISKTWQNAYSGAAFAVIFIFLFLRNWKPTITIAISIPFSIIVTFIALYFSGNTLNMLTLLGLALGVGMMVDNSIVVIENIFRHRGEGKGLDEASIMGAEEVGMAITASTLTTISVFFPIFFAGGLPGKLAKGIAVTVVFSLLASLLIAITIVPMLASVLFKGKGFGDLPAGGNKRESGWEKIRKRYSTLLEVVLKRRVAVLLLTFALFIVSVAGASFLGGEFLPRMDSEFVDARVSLPVDSTLKETERVIIQLEEALKKVDGVEMVGSSIGVGEMGFEAAEGTTGVNSGEIFCRLRERERRKVKSYEIEEFLRNLLPPMEETRLQVVEMGGMSSYIGGQAPVEVRIFGEDIDRLQAISTETARRIRGIEGIKDVKVEFKKGKQELRIVPDREKASLYGLTVTEVANLVKIYTTGVVASRMTLGGEEMDMRVRLDTPFRDSLRDIKLFPLPTRLGTILPLSQVTHIKEERGPLQIFREGQKRKISVTANVGGRDLKGAARDVKRVVEEMKRDGTVPSDYFVDVGGQYELMKDVFEVMGLGIFFAILLVYMVMASQFESFLHPFIIILTIPMGFIGVSSAMILTGTSISFISLVGMLILSGIAVNNGIVMVDYINRLRRGGMGLFPAVIRGASVRLRPVLLTSLTTIFALLPMAFTKSQGAEYRSPMAISVIGGLLFATFLTLFIIPSFYVVMAGKGRKGTG